MAISKEYKDYNEVIQLCVNIFNKAFETSYCVEYDSRTNILRANPDIKVGDKAAGFYDTKSKKIFIFSDAIEKIKSKGYKSLNGQYDNGLAFLIRAVYHELEHFLQRENPGKLKNQFSYAKAMYDIEKIILSMQHIDKEIIDIKYEEVHDSFLIEIDADIKGVNNARATVEHCNISRNKSRLL